MAALAYAVPSMGDAWASSNSCTHPVHRAEHIVCGSPRLRRLDAELGRLYDAIESETHGIDGETGEVIDHFGDEHRCWMSGTRNRCRTEACLVEAYRTRIAQVKRRWRDVLQGG